MEVYHSTNQLPSFSRASKSRIILFALLFAICKIALAQSSAAMQYEASAEYPFGRVNPDAPAALADYEPMIGICDCQSFVAKPDGTWNVPEKMTWMFKYIMNGTAVQDQTLKEGGGHSGSIRQYSSDSAKWYVHYYAVGKITSVSGYHGSAKEDDIVLYKRVSDISHEGKDLYYRLTFSSVTKNGFNWIGEWVDPSAAPDTAFGATWKIECIKRED